MAEPPGYPAGLEKQVRLDDGTPALIRPIRRDDVDLMEALFYRLSPETVYLRFHAPLREMPRDAIERYCTVDYRHTLALVAQVQAAAGPALIGVARYARLPDSDLAEAAVVVADAWQRRGVGGRLLVHLIRAARQNGIRGFVAEVLAENLAIRHICAQSGHHYTSHWANGAYHITIHFAPNH